MTLRERYNDVLIDRIRSCRYPSKELMDRAELTLASKQEAEAYGDVLVDKITKYPSLQILDRLTGLIYRIEAAERSEASA